MNTKNKLAQIEFYFPKGKFKTQKALINKIVSTMKKKGDLDFSGFENIKSLKEGIFKSMGSDNVARYRGISEKEQADIEEIIVDTISKCNEKLPVPLKNFVFVRPYFPSKEDEVFGGSMGLATYSCVFHLFIDLDSYSKRQLKSTVAHELNHTIYMYHHYEKMMGEGFALLDNLAMEGLAEVFREDVLGGDIAPWSVALSKEEAFGFLCKLPEDSLYSEDRNLISDVLFGDDNEFKHWTGYSVGYWLVKEFIAQHKNLSWDEIMKLDPKEFIK